MKTEKEFRKVTDIVEELLRNDIRCRNDDKWLTYQVMRRFTDIYIPFKDFEKIPSFETIKRCRAKIQNNDGKYLPTLESVRKKRHQRQKKVKELFSTGR